MFSEKFACKYCDFSVPELEPRLFSFNSPLGACPACNGLGHKLEISEELIIDKDKSINDGCILPYKNADSNNLYVTSIEIVCKHFNIDLDTPYKDLPENQKQIILYGSDEVIYFKQVANSGRVHEKHDVFEGVINHFNRRYRETNSEWIRTWLENYMVESVCPVCHGDRLNDLALCVRIDKYNISELMNMSIKDLYHFITNLKLDPEKTKIASLAIKEITDRLKFLLDVGLEYLSLSRGASTLSGGEAQRIRLATQIGSQLSGVLYVLDEPSIGLHQKDNERLIKSLQKMRDLGNTLIVVEHDEETMMASDHLIDIGPYAGVHGGTVVAQGTPEEVKNNPNSITGRFLSKKEIIERNKTIRPGNNKFIKIIGCEENNLKNIDVTLPLGKIICVTGVSGSGKSTLVNQILFNAAYKKLYKSKVIPGKHKSIEGLENIEKVIDISQSPIGRTPRSNPATYTGIFDDIRDIFAKTNEAKLRGYDKGRFSFNVKGGRCESCWGDGVKRISMHFLPDVYVPCEVCKGKRYNRETLDIHYKGKNISDVLDMTVEEALEFFENHKKLKNKIQTMYDVGLGYIKLGQSATTLSGGEAQRVKLASELNRPITDKTLYILDEPTTGLHQYDIKKLMAVLNRICDLGATIIIIEHNIDVIKCADHIIDLGPDGGDNGGTIVFEGTVDEIINCKNSYTGQFIKKTLDEENK